MYSAKNEASATINDNLQNISAERSVRLSKIPKLQFCCKINHSIWQNLSDFNILMPQFAIKCVMASTLVL